MISERFTITVEGSTVVGVLHRPRVPGAACVVACHGMGASKDSEKYLLLAEAFPEAGLALARFDFRGSGESGGTFEAATIATRVADLEAVLRHLGGRSGLGGRIGLLGSSLGGFVALWGAVGRPGLPVVTWNAPATLAGLRREDAEASGAVPALLEEIRAGRFAEAPAGASGVLVIHGDRDEVVPVAQAQLIFDRAREPRALRVLPGADHRLSDPAHRLQAVAMSREWLVAHLS